VGPAAPPGDNAERQSEGFDLPRAPEYNPGSIAPDKQRDYHRPRDAVSKTSSTDFVRRREASRRRKARLRTAPRAFSTDFVDRAAALFATEGGCSVSEAERFVATLIGQSGPLRNLTESDILEILVLATRTDGHRPTTASRYARLLRAEAKRAAGRARLKKAAPGVSALTGNLRKSGSASFPSAATYDGSPFIRTPVGGQPRRK